jgi:uroporphyrinogen-III synthase
MMTQPGPDQPLADRVIALPESRRLDVFAAMLEKRGATVHRCPLVAIHDAPDPGPVEAWLDALIGDALDDVILYTGEGTRRLAAFAERRGRKAAFIEALGRTRRITRGPKPVQALRELGLKPEAQAASPTTDGLIETLETLDLPGRTVGVQMYGQKPNEKLEATLDRLGASPRVVYPYVYASQAEDAQVIELIEALSRGEIDTVAFTSEAQVDRLWTLAKQRGITETVTAALGRAAIAAVGPVVGEALKQRGVAVDAMPDEPFALKPLMNAIIAAHDRAAAT